MEFAKGLEGVIAAESKICRIDGQVGSLRYMGYSIEDLVEHSTFEEVTYLLLHGELPTQFEMDRFQIRMRVGRELHPAILSMIKNFPPDAHPMELLQSVVSYLSGYVKHKIHHSPTCNCRDTLSQISQMTSVVAAYHRLSKGEEYVPPRQDLSHGANFLYMLRGEEPDAEEGEMMDKCLILHAEHSFNASTFTARVVASTMSTCYCSISAAVGALYGSLHGGANEKVIAMVESIGSKDKAESWTNKAIDEKRKVMGMGHRVYKARDPRSRIMEDFLERLSQKKGNTRNLDILRIVQHTFRERMEQKGKPIYANVDFFSGSLYELMEIPSILFTPIFAMARVSGWLAHILEQREDNRLFRPKAQYIGYEEREFAPIDKRG